MSWHDQSLPTGGVRYVIRRECLDSRFQWESSASELITAVPYRLHVLGFLPNPTTAEPVVSLTLAGDAEATLELFAANGRRVLRRRVEDPGPGQHSISLEGYNLKPGVYWIRLTQDGRSSASRGVILR
jgi:hypothetical protein